MQFTCVHRFGGSLIILIFRLSLASGVQHTTEHVATVHFVNPCQDMIKPNFEPEGWQGMSLECKNSQYLLHLCNEHYEGRFYKAIEAASTCNPTTRHKRQIGPALQIAVTAATNLITAFATRSAQDRSSVVDRMYQNFSVKELFSRTVLPFVKIHTETADNHLEKLYQEAKLMPRIIWATAKAHSEIAAASALVETIDNYCRFGRVATRELGELIDSPEISEINPMQTEIIGISRGKHSNSLTIHFIVKKQVDEDINIEYLQIGLLSFCILLGITIIVYVLHEKNKISQSAVQVNPFT